jgi:transcriptional regulator with PAS, ATPase and Fis domain
MSGFIYRASKNGKSDILNGDKERCSWINRRHDAFHPVKYCWFYRTKNLCGSAAVRNKRCCPHHCGYQPKFAEAIANKSFREDLFYRLNVIAFHLPPLRDRKEDIIPLAEAFIKKYNQILGSNVTGIKQEARNALSRYTWPGNIRELENAIERAANYVWEGEIGCDDLPEQIFQVEQEQIDFSSYRTTLEEVDRDMLIEVLKKTNGNKSEAARILKISRSAFYEKLAKYGL